MCKTNVHEQTIYIKLFVSVSYYAVCNKLLQEHREKSKTLVERLQNVIDKISYFMYCQVLVHILNTVTGAAFYCTWQNSCL